MQYWIWLIIGAGLIVLEIIVPSFVIIWFGIAGLLTGILAYFWVKTLALQVLTFTILSAISFSIGWFGLIKRSKIKSLVGQGKESVIGEQGIVSSVVEGDFYTGKIRFQIPILGSDEWEFVSDELVVHGDRCVVTDVIGHKVRIRKN